MSNMFDYRKSLNGIKANLFDIYENVSLIVLSHSISPVPLVSITATSSLYIPLS